MHFEDLEKPTLKGGTCRRSDHMSVPPPPSSSYKHTENDVIITSFHPRIAGEFNCTPFSKFFKNQAILKNNFFLHFVYSLDKL